MRVVSLLPSATEMLLALAPEALVPEGLTRTSPPSLPILVGRSHECDYPPTGQALGDALAKLPVLTQARTAFESSAQVDRDVRAAITAGQALYHLDADLLARLQPDLILTQDLCSVCSIDLASVRAVAAGLPRPARVLSFNPQGIEGVLDDLLTLGEALDEAGGMAGQFAARAAGLVVSLRDRMDRAQERVPAFVPRPNVAFLEWTDPLYCAGHWAPQLIERAGGEHPLNPTRAIDSAGAGEGVVGQTLRRAGHSIRVDPRILAATRPEYLFIAPCGLNLRQCIEQANLLAGQSWFESLPAVRHARAGQCEGPQSNDGRVSGAPARVWCIDGNQMFNRPGPRLVNALEFLVDVLQGNVGVSGVALRGFPAVAWPV